MPLNGKLSKNELLLPNIILFNQMFVEAQRIGGGRRTADVKTKLPNLQSTNESICSCGQHDEKNRLKPSSGKQSVDYFGNSLEFLNIVDHAPIEMKFLSRTEIREPQPVNHDKCTRWLERLEKSIQEVMAQARPASEVSRMSQEWLNMNSKPSNYMSDWEFHPAKQKCAEVIMSEQGSAEGKGGRSNSGKINTALQEKVSRTSRTPQGKTLFIEKQNLENEEEVLQARDLSKKNSKIVDDYDLYLQFTTKRIDLVQRDFSYQKKENKSSQQKKCQNEYEISVDLFKPKSPGGVENEEKRSLRKNEVKQNVCSRFERRFKSAPKERTHRSNDETIKSSKIRLYPFYEAKWKKEQRNDEGCSYLVAKEVKSNEKADGTRLIDFGKGFLNIDESSKVNEHLKVSSLQLAPKKTGDEAQRNDTNVESKEKEKRDSDIKIMQVVCSPRPKPNEEENANEISEGSFDLANLLMMNSSSLRETLSLLARITASSMMLTNKQILKLIENGDLNISRFLIIKKLLLTIHPHQYPSIAGVGRPRKEIVSLLFAVLEFIDRCEKILKQAKGISSIELYENGNGEIDCTKRGVVIGKMPAISVMGYSRKNVIVSDKKQDMYKEKKSKVEMIKGRKIRAKKEKQEEQLVKKAVSITSLRRSILVSAMDLVTNNQWERSYLLKKKYMPKRKKILRKTLRSFHKPSHKNHVTANNAKRNFTKKTSYPPPVASPSSQNSVSTCFESGELQDVHIPTEQSVLNEIIRDELERAIEASPDAQRTDVNKEEEQPMVEKQSNKESDAQKLEIQKQKPRKVCEFLKGRVKSKLQATFDLYPKIHKLISCLHDKTQNIVDIRAVRDSKTDFISHFKLVEENRYEMYCRAFAKADKLDNGYITVEMVKQAAKFVDSIASCPAKYVDYTLTVLDILMHSKITIKMFCVICGVLERMWQGGVVIQDAVDALDLLLSEGTMIWYKEIFYEASEIGKNFINLETVKLELFAGGMNVEEERKISEKIVNKENQRISYLDFIAYIPLFIAIHDKICANAFD